MNDDMQSAVVAMQFVNENWSEVAHLNQYVYPVSWFMLS